jgi:hypothetical protein
VADLERELSEVRACLMQLVEAWDEETEESVENQSCAFQAPPDWETLIQWREAAGYDTANAPVSGGTPSAPVACSTFDYRGEFERLRVAIEQASAAGFRSAAANGVLDSAVKLYADILPNSSIGRCGDE